MKQFIVIAVFLVLVGVTSVEAVCTPPDCGDHGTCTNNACDCTLPYSGSSCTDCGNLRGPCANGGNCTGSTLAAATCTCASTWGGPRCTGCTTDTQCGQGTCPTGQDPRNCSCNAGYTGTYCDKKIPTAAPTTIAASGDPGKSTPKSGGAAVLMTGATKAFTVAGVAAASVIAVWWRTAA